jgi:hypothetical protein
MILILHLEGKVSRQRAALARQPAHYEVLGAGQYLPDRQIFRRIGQMAVMLSFALLIDAVGSGARGGETRPPQPEPLKSDVLCAELETQAIARTLPADFFVRLIWKESRFNPQAVSPKGAEGIAQFMPSTAAERGLADSFDPMLAIAASAAYLADLAAEFGNVGLAAAAYNAGPERVRDWIAGRSNSLPWETVDYVQFITGRPVEDWKEANTALPKLLEDGQSLQDWCRALPMQKRIYQPSYESQPATAPRLPWGVQVAAHFNREAAMAIFGRLKKQYASVLTGRQPTVVRHRNPGFGRKARYAVRVSFNSQAEAEKLCRGLRARGGACGVTKN